jgi:hypothetical protein
MTWSVIANQDGNYYLWARVLAPNPSAASFYISFDGGPEDVYETAYNRWSNNWQWTAVNGRNGGAPLTLNPRVFFLKRLAQIGYSLSPGRFEH